MLSKFFSLVAPLFCSPLRLLLSIGTALVAAIPLPCLAIAIDVPNYSFESPATNTPGFPVNVALENWIDTTASDSFGTGNFPNPAVGMDNRFTNMEGDRAAYILASLNLGFYQELTSPAGSFTVGQAYLLTVGLSAQAGTPGGSQNDNSTGGPVVIVDGSTVLSLSLFYTVGGVITHIPGATTPVSAFPDTNTFVDFTATVPTVQASDPWAGQPIGILLQMTTVTAENGGFDVDNIRLDQVPEPTSAVLMGLSALLLAAQRRVRRG